MSNYHVANSPGDSHFTPTAAKGDPLVYQADGKPAVVLPVGTNGQVLTGWHFIR